MLIVVFVGSVLIIGFCKWMEHKTGDPLSGQMLLLLLAMICGAVALGLFLLPILIVIVLAAIPLVVVGTLLYLVVNLLKPAGDRPKLPR